MLRVSRLIVQELGREPSAGEIGARMELSPDKVGAYYASAASHLARDPVGGRGSHRGDSAKTKCTGAVEAADSLNLCDQTRRVRRRDTE